MGCFLRGERERTQFKCESVVGLFCDLLQPVSRCIIQQDKLFCSRLQC